ncbi:MAG: serine/threonine protein kinase [Phycisphaerales bacterium]
MGASAAEPTPGASEGHPSIANFVISRRIGQGSGGVVYEGYRIGSDRRLAIKVLSKAFTQGEKATRAWRELDMLSQIHHPSVPMVIDFGVHEGHLFIATEFIAGDTLDEACSKNNLGLTDRVALLAHVADGVQALHERGVIHRDLKPGNIMVTPSGDPVIVDLGVAALIAADPVDTLSVDGMPLGSPAFMAPEQARGDRSQISIRSDIFALGATAYLLLTGSTPHAMDGTLHAAIRRVAEEPARDPRLLDPNLPKRVAAILLKACDLNPARRYASAAGFAADLRRWLAGEPVEAVAPTAWERCTRWLGRHPILATAAACLSLLLASILALVGSVWWLNQQPYRLTLTSDGSEARLVSRTGAIIDSWAASPSYGVFAFAAMVDRPKAFGGGRIGLLAVPPGGDQRAEPGNLVAIDPFKPVRVLWSTASWPIRVPPPYDRPDDSFRVFYVLLAEVFSEVPGQELIVIHKHHHFGQYAIRIYDLAGKVRYEAWHHGHLETLGWLPADDILVVGGVSNAHDQAARAPAHANIASRWEYVVFGLRPQLDARLHWINRNSAHPESSARPTWYKRFDPPSVADLFDVPRIGPSKIYHLRSRCVSVTLHRSTPPGTMTGSRGTYVMHIGPDGSKAADDIVSDMVEKELGLKPGAFRLEAAPLPHLVEGR